MPSTNKTRKAMKKYHEVKVIFKKIAMNIHELLFDNEDPNKTISKQSIVNYRLRQNTSAISTLLIMMIAEKEHKQFNYYVEQ
ncbi:Pyruvate, phosphate dikinase [Dirofilaria immitis]